MTQKIVFLMRDFRMGGGERMTLFLVSRLDRDVFLPKIVALNNRGPQTKLVPSDVEVVTLQGSQGGALGFAWRTVLYALRFRKIIERERPALVVTDNWFVGIIACLTAGTIRQCGAKLVVEFHLPVHEFLGTSSFGNMLAPVKSYVTASLFKRADRIVAVSEHIRSEISKRLAIDKRKITTIYNGVDDQTLRSQSRIVDDCHSCQRPYIISVGRLSSEKNHELLIRAYATIADRIDQNLIIVGDGERRPNLEKLVAELHLRERVMMPGVIHNPFPLMSRADFLVLPSRWEAFPFTLLEALSLEVPIIATECDGPMEILHEGKYGFMVPVSDSNALAEAMLRFATDPEFRNSYRVNSLCRAREFSLSKMVNDYDGLFTSLCVEKEA